MALQHIYWMRFRPENHSDWQSGNPAVATCACPEKYKDYLYINIMPDERQNITFYQKHGFTLLEDGAAMQIRHL